MAQTHNAPQHEQRENDISLLWAQAAEADKHETHDGLPVIGISSKTDESGPGFLVHLHPPAWFGLIPDADQRLDVFRAWTEHKLRDGQSMFDPKVHKTPADLERALNNGVYEPKRKTVTAPISTETLRRMTSFITSLYVAKDAQTTDAKEKAEIAKVLSNIEAQVGAELKLERGRAKYAALRREVEADMTYTPQRKTKGGGAASTDMVNY